ncbi:MAG: ribonuclease III [Chloroflexota bacterium]
MTDLNNLEEILGISFKDPSLLSQALVHSSYSNENPGFISNERLEFLGDAVLGLIIAGKLFQDDPRASEGEMTKRRAMLVSRDTLARIAGAINLGDYLYLGKGEKAGGGHLKPANLASALEAVIAAVFLDQGFDATRPMVLHLFRKETREIAGMGREDDYKSLLQELIQAKGQGAPTYRLTMEEGPAHDKTFTVEVLEGEKVLATGTGKNKKAAEIEAAHKALGQFSRGFTE